LKGSPAKKRRTSTPLAPGEASATTMATKAAKLQATQKATQKKDAKLILKRDEATDTWARWDAQFDEMLTFEKTGPRVSRWRLLFKRVEDANRSIQSDNLLIQNRQCESCTTHGEFILIHF
jgi:hypothetical protein